MSAEKPTAKTYPSWTWQKTEMRGVYKRGSRYIVMTRPDGKRKVIHRFATYEEAVAFKVTTPCNKRRDEPSRWINKGMGDHLRGDPCSYCGGPGGTVDHIIPRNAGGPNEWQNLTGACGRCNSRKADKSLLIFLAYTHGCWEWRQLAE